MKKIKTADSDANSAGPRNAQLEAAILANPDDRDAIGALGAWLRNQGDPWGT